MAIGTPTTIGTAQNGGSGTSVAITTSATVPSGGRIIVSVSYWDGGATNGRLASISDGAAYTQDKQSINGDDIIEVWSRDAASGLASGSTITATFSPSFTGGRLISAAYVTGVATSSYVDTTTSSNGTSTNWSSGAASNTTAEALFWGACGIEDTTNPTTSTQDVGTTEVHDMYLSTEGQGMQTGRRVETTAASRSVSGTLSNAASTANTGCLVIYAADGGTAVAPVLPPAFNAVPFMGVPISG